MKEIIGKTPVKIECSDDEISMQFSDGTSCEWMHYQRCCETVYVDDVNGDWANLIGSPLLVAEERDSSDAPYKGGECEEWTFYTFRGIGGSVDVKWYGDSNGYYSTAVSFTFNP